MINYVTINLQAALPLHLVSPLVWPLYSSIALYCLTTIYPLGIFLIYFNILFRILYFSVEFLYYPFFCYEFLSWLVLREYSLNIKRGSDEQSTDKTQDKEIENRQAKNLLNDTLKKLKDLEEKKVPENIDEGKPIPTKDFKTAKDIEEQYPEFFDEDSGNSSNKKQGYSELKEYLQEELDALPGTKETSAMGESNDRETKKSKPSSSEESEAKSKPSSSDESQGKPKPSSLDSSEAKDKGSLIDDFANPNNEFGDWTGGDD